MLKLVILASEKHQVGLNRNAYRYENLLWGRKLTPRVTAPKAIIATVNAALIIQSLPPAFTMVNSSSPSALASILISKDIQPNKLPQPRLLHLCSTSSDTLCWLAPLQETALILSLSSQKAKDGLRWEVGLLKLSAKLLGVRKVLVCLCVKAWGLCCIEQAFTLNIGAEALYISVHVLAGAISPRCNRYRIQSQGKSYQFAGSRTRTPWYELAAINDLCLTQIYALSLHYFGVCIYLSCEILKSVDYREDNTF